MSDQVFNIKLTAREIDLLHQCISTNMETVKRRHDPNDPMIAELLTELRDLSIDLLEQQARPGEWNDPEDPDLFMDPVDFAAKHDPLVNRTFTVSEDDFIKQGIEAREQAKASSRAAARRDFNLRGPDRKLSDAQRHDVWEKPSNDPVDW